MLLACLISCAPEMPDEGTLPETEPGSVLETETESAETDYVTPENFDIVINGETTVKIIRPENLNSGNSYVDAAIALRDVIEAATGARPKLGDAFKKDTESYDDSTLEILVGKTKHGQVASVAKDLSYGQYAIKAVGNKIVIMGYSDAAIEAAVKDFTVIVETYTNKQNGTSNLSIPAEALNIVDECGDAKALNAVPPRVINDNIPGIATSITGTASMNYPYGKIVITVDAATGNVKTADYDVQWTINFDKAGAIIPLGTKSSYVVTF